MNDDDDNKYRLNAIAGEVINYHIIAHHYEPQSIESEIGGESIVNGCFVGPSDLSVTAFGLHQRKRCAKV